MGTFGPQRNKYQCTHTHTTSFFFIKHLYETCISATYNTPCLELKNCSTLSVTYLPVMFGCLPQASRTQRRESRGIYRGCLPSLQTPAVSSSLSFVDLQCSARLPQPSLSRTHGYPLQYVWEYPPRGVFGLLLAYKSVSSSATPPLTERKRHCTEAQRTATTDCRFHLNIKIKK